jgi:hypothetical protein
MRVFMLGFYKIEFAVYALILLNSTTTVQFLQSITFPDAKRTFTKDILMRIDMLKLAKRIDKAELQAQLEALNKKYRLNLMLNLWNSFINEMTPVTSGQMAIF